MVGSSMERYSGQELTTMSDSGGEVYAASK